MSIIGRRGTLHCPHCEFDFSRLFEEIKYCPRCGTLVVYPDIHWNVFSPWRGGFSTRYGGWISYSRDSVLEAEQANSCYGTRESWLASYKPAQVTPVPGSYEFYEYKVLTWDRIEHQNGKLVLIPDNPPAEGVHVTNLE